MIEPAEVFVVTLAAGLSRRFGRDKLAAAWGERTVLTASLDCVAGRDWCGRVVVSNQARAAAIARDHPSLDILVNERPDVGMGRSLAMGAIAARKCGARAVLVTLADMPAVKSETITRLLEAFPDHEAGLAAVWLEGDQLGPPALFGRSWFDSLAMMRDDRGARGILRDPANSPAKVRIKADEAVDIDRPSDLAGKGIA